MMCAYFFFFFKQKTAYEMRISDWSSDVCSSDLHEHRLAAEFEEHALQRLGAIGHDLLADRGRAGERHQIDARVLGQHLASRDRIGAGELGRASCRERVGQYV